ncbi:PH domain-containing protein, partial [Streptomyces sp. G2]|uniref:PH domain-containing protein n=1 Tax=Streptomyces sp. G2 TaxID=1684471 RepID=UPI00202EB930
MTQPLGLGGRPLTPAPGAPTPELLVAKFRGHARRLFWSALVLIAVAGACGYFYGNLPAGLDDWMLLTAAGAAVLLLVVLPFLSWWGHVYTITTRRVMERRGVFSATRRELEHVRGYTLNVKRGLLQR